MLGNNSISQFLGGSRLSKNKSSYEPVLTFSGYPQEKVDKKTACLFVLFLFSLPLTEFADKKLNVIAFSTAAHLLINSIQSATLVESHAHPRVGHPDPGGNFNRQWTGVCNFEV